jgi:hypothetical protein
MTTPVPTPPLFAQHNLLQTNHSSLTLTAPSVISDSSIPKKDDLITPPLSKNLSVAPPSLIYRNPGDIESIAQELSSNCGVDLILMRKAAMIGNNPACWLDEKLELTEEEMKGLKEELTNRFKQPWML